VTPAIKVHSVCNRDVALARDPWLDRVRLYGSRWLHSDRVPESYYDAVDIGAPDAALREAAAFIVEADEFRVERETRIRWAEDALREANR
jgi:hypothetical protein